MAMNPLEALDVKHTDDVTAADVTSPQSHPSTQVVSPAAVEEKRKMWQIFTDNNGDVQRKSFTVTSHDAQNADNRKQNHNDVGDDTNAEETDTLLSPTYSSGVHPHAAAANGGAAFNVMPPPKPARMVEIVARANGTHTDTVVFQKDTTYVPLNTVGIESDEELFEGQ